MSGEGGGRLRLQEEDVGRCVEVGWKSGQTEGEEGGLASGVAAWSA